MRIAWRRTACSNVNEHLAGALYAPQWTATSPTADLPSLSQDSGHTNGSKEGSPRSSSPGAGSDPNRTCTELDSDANRRAGNTPAEFLRACACVQDVVQRWPERDPEAYHLLDPDLRSFHCGPEVVTIFAHSQLPPGSLLQRVVRATHLTPGTVTCGTPVSCQLAVSWHKVAPQDQQNESVPQSVRSLH